jgi:N-acyl-D-aspartate/D-glutamate deacylase
VLQLALAGDEALAIEGQQVRGVAAVVGPGVAGALVERDGEVTADLQIGER